VLLPPPHEVFQALWHDLAKGSLTADLWKTIYRSLLAMVLATVVGVPLGLFLGLSEKRYRLAEFVVDFFRSTPSSALLPLFLLFFGVGDKTKIFTAAFGASLAILFNVAYGVMNARKTRLAAARIMGASPLGVFFVILLESMPQTIVGLRIALSLSLIIVIVGEMFIGSTDGIGMNIFEKQQLFDMPSMYGGILLSGFLGYAANYLLRSIEKKFVHWSGK
jgi:NitT/TauT family transport system permease protein